MRRKVWGRWTVLFLAAASLSVPGCRDRGDYQPPGYAPPPPPPPEAAKNMVERGPAPLKRVDLKNIPATLTDPKDSTNPSTDLKSVIAGIQDNEIVIRFETYGKPFDDKNTWFLAWLSTAQSPLLFKVQVSPAGSYVLGGVMEGEKVKSEDTVVSNTVEIEGNVVVARFPWSKLPKEMQMRDLRISEPSIIASQSEEGTPKTVDAIEGSDKVRM